MSVRHSLVHSKKETYVNLIKMRFEDESTLSAKWDAGPSAGQQNSFPENVAYAIGS